MARARRQIASLPARPIVDETTAARLALKVKAARFALARQRYSAWLEASLNRREYQTRDG